MQQSPVETIAFDLLLKGPATGSSRQPDVANIDQFKPPPEAIERCRRWLDEQGITCYPTEFGLACSAPAARFEELFAVSLEPTEPEPGTPPLRMTDSPRVPEPIADLVDQITLTARPELF